MRGNSHVRFLGEGKAERLYPYPTFKSSEILGKIEELIKIPKIHSVGDEVEAGLSMMRKGGDFADGVNAYSGRKISSQAVFASFDRKAVRLLAEQGIATLLPE